MMKLVIFDLWNTLIYKKVNLDMYHKVLKKKNIRISRKEFISILPPVKRKSCLETVSELTSLNKDLKGIKNLCRNLGLKASKENISLIVDIRDEREESVNTYSHTYSILKKLKKQGFKVGIISNISVFSAKRVKKHTNILSYIDYKLFSYIAGTVKPDKKIFEKMLKKAGVKPEQALMIGDNYENDVKTPRSLGMKAILYKNYPQLKKELRKAGINI